MEVIYRALEAAVEAVAGAIRDILDYARRRFGSAGYAPDADYAPTAQDRYYIEASRDILAGTLPEGMQTLLEKDLPRRAELTRDLVRQTALCYDVDIRRIEFVPTGHFVAEGYPPNTYGYFLQGENAILFNADLLADSDPARLRDAVDTVFHECRHAYQYRVVTDAGYLRAGDPVVKSWCYNFVHYHTAAEDLEAYYNQPIEADARNFSARIMEGFL